MSQFSVEFFLSHSTKPFRRGTLLYCVSEKFWWRKKILKRWVRGGISIFYVENFLSQNAEKFRTGNFYLSLFSGIENVYASEGFVTIFRRNVFVSQYRNIS